MRGKRASARVWTWIVMALIVVNIIALFVLTVTPEVKLAPFLPEGKTWEFTPFKSIALRVLTGTLFGLIIALGLLMRHNYKLAHPKASDSGESEGSMSVKSDNDDDDKGNGDESESSMNAQPQQRIFQTSRNVNNSGRTGQLIRSPMPSLPNADSNRFSSGI